MTYREDSKKEVKMINRNMVAREKLEAAAELLTENRLDLWVVYSRKRQDPSLELLFNFNTDNEILFMIQKDGNHVALAAEADTEKLLEAGLFKEVVAVTPETVMACFKDRLHKLNPKKIALNISTEDARCDGLALGLYRKLCGCIGAEAMQNLEVSSYEMLEYLRAVKTPSEVAIMEECSKITTDIYDVVFRKIRAGMSETQVGDIMMEELAKRGCGTGIGDPTEYPLILLVRCGMSHRKPSGKNYIKPGDMLVIDFSARYNGYTSDIARTMYFLKEGEEHAPADVKHCVDSAIRAVGEVLKVIKPGLKGYEVDAVGRQSILDSGYPNIPHSVGHQVGLECHDGGTILGPNRQKKSMCGVLRKNEIYAIEPTVLQGGGLPCAIVEDNVILTEDGCRLISKRQTEIIEIPCRE
jgi:Xaa-Pro aminopeptidase